MTDNELIEAVAVEVVEADKTWGLSQILYFDTIDKQWMVGYPIVNPLTNPTVFDPLTNSNHWMMVVEKVESKEFIYAFRLLHAYHHEYPEDKVWFAQFISALDGYSIPCHWNKSIGHAVCLAALAATKNTWTPADGS